VRRRRRRREARGDGGSGSALHVCVCSECGGDEDSCLHCCGFAFVSCEARQGKARQVL